MQSLVLCGQWAIVGTDSTLNWDLRQETGSNFHFPLDSLLQSGLEPWHTSLYSMHGWQKMINAWVYLRLFVITENRGREPKSTKGIALAVRHLWWIENWACDTCTIEKCYNILMMFDPVFDNVLYYEYSLDSDYMKIKENHTELMVIHLVIFIFWY